MKNSVIPCSISKKILMTGVYYRNNHPGGISSVIQYWSKYIEGLRYIPSFKEGNNFTKIWWYVLSFIRLFFVFLFDKRVKILHSHTAAGTDFRRTTSYVNLAKIFGKKVIIHSHASMFKDYYNQASVSKKQKILKTLNKADVLIVLSESWKKWFSSIGVNVKKIFILHNITDYPIEKDVEKDIRKLKLLFLGEIGSRKGVFDILRAVTANREVLKDKIEIRIGGNKEEEKLIQTINDNHLTSFVMFEGFVSGKKKIELLNWADVYILPSFNEGLPISILEAMSYGMPIITTPVGGIPEVVDVNNGVIVTPGNEKEIFDAISFYINNPGMLVIHGAKSKERAKEYLPSFVINQLRGLYSSILQ